MDQLTETQELLDQVNELLPKFEGRPGANDLAQVAEELRRDLLDIRRMEAQMNAFAQRAK